MTVRSALPALAAAALAVAALPVAASAKTPTCPGKAHTVFHSSYGRAWVAKSSLYSCTTVYGHKRVVRLGPWKTGSKLAWTATHAVWSAPLTKGGKVVGDRIYAGSTESGK